MGTLFAASSRKDHLRVLITGHTGFKGSWLTLLLEHLGHDVSGLSLSPIEDSLYDRIENWQHDSHIGDIRDEEFVADVVRGVQPDIVFHFAAQALVLKSIQEPVETFQTNVLGTANLLEACRKTPSVKSILVSTTDKVYLNQHMRLRFSETDSLGGKDPYSASKVSQEQVINAWRFLSQIENGPKVLTARAGNVIGGGDLAQNRLIPDVIRGWENKQPVIIRNPASTRPWQHVIDPLIGYCMYVDNSLKGDVETALNFGPQGNSETVVSVLKEFRRHWPSEIEIALVEADSNLEAKSLELNSTRAEQELGWYPTLTQLEAVAATATWWKKILIEQASARDTSLVDIRTALAKSRFPKESTPNNEGLHGQE